MGCSFVTSEGENRRLRSNEGPHFKLERYRRQLQVEGEALDSEERLSRLKAKFSRLQLDIQQKTLEIRQLKSTETTSHRNSQKFTRKHTREIHADEASLHETRALMINLEDENAFLQSKLSETVVLTEDVTDLQLELDELQSDLGKLVAYNQKLIMEKALMMFCSGVHINMLLGFSLWKRGNALPSQSFMSPPDIESITHEREELLHSSPIYPTLGKIDYSNVRPMSRISVILLFENLLDEKFEQDMRDVTAGRVLKPVTEFLQDYMNRRHGLPAMAIKKLAQFVLGLISLYTGGYAYAKVMCGMFNIIRHEPMHANCSIYLTHIRYVFQTLKEKKRRPLERPRSNSNAIKPKQDYRREKFDNIDAGGSAPLVYVCDLIYTVFKDFPASGEQLLRLIKPPELSIENFIIFKICHKMAQDGCSPEDLFRRLDLDHGGTIDHMEFQRGIQQLMGLWLSTDDLVSAMDRISPGRSEITRDQFSRVINSDAYYNSPALKDLNVSGASFLLSLMNVYQGIIEECAGVFRSVTSREEIQLSEFENAVGRFDATQSRVDIVRIYNNAATEKMDLQAFLDVCQSEYLGRFKSFGKETRQIIGNWKGKLGKEKPSEEKGKRRKGKTRRSPFYSANESYSSPRKDDRV